ncbi:GNAT family N-acetyltransferase [Sphaerisporangium sp. TRM90804]|uniref:GNAT family N-acetyltransferase n=1 Tax=Sphaerisporangium sp. TRM90804 TaxID=3031113 RepID=UPI002448AD70|nr:GNAT family N-acetyltransferase [Sphaerisporangium sp. TRM90804]MDH2428688.1 GNAT family N-acetyltransferase [Sphaerisporangium sp. TRM90804]
MIELRRTGPEGFTAALETVIGIYTAAMRPPIEQLSGRQGIMRNHASFPDFTCLLAHETGGQVVGFGYAFHGAHGQWWHDVVRRALEDSAGAPVAEQWFGDALEIAEIHVHPGYQGKGVGRRLVQGLCEGRGERTAVLSTHDLPTAARHLYGKLGFVDLMQAFVFPGGYERYAIVGAALPLPSST